MKEELLTEEDIKQIEEMLGINKIHTAYNMKQVTKIAKEIGFPLFMKCHKINHKEDKMWTPEVILVSANKVEEKTPYYCLEDYGEAIDVLYYKKGLTYREIKEWFVSHGVERSIGSFSNAHKLWKLKNS